MTDHISTKNPYIVGSPVSGQEMFFGRDDVFEWIRLNLIGAHHEQPLIIAGQRRTGKTSVLKQIENGRLGQRYLPFFFDLQGFYIENSAGFLWELAVSASIALDKHQIAIPDLDLESFMGNPYQEFQNQWLTPVLKKLGQRRLLLLFDETEVLEDRLRHGRLDYSIFDYLRSLVQNNPSVSLIFGMGRRLDSFSQESIRLFNIALYKQINYLSYSAATQLISRPAPYEVPTEAIDAILQLTNGHPYYTQLICHTLFERWQTERFETLAAAEIPQIIDTVLERGTAALTYVWLYDGVTTDERLLMSALAMLTAQDRPISLPDVQELLAQNGYPLPDTVLVNAVIGLEEQQIITHRGHLAFQVDLVAHWLRHERPLGWTIAQAQKVSRLAEQYATAAQILMERGDASQAEAEYQRALSEDPTHIRSILGVSHIATQNKQWTQASIGYEKVLALQEAHQVAEDGFVKARLARAKRNIQEGRSLDAEADYRAVLAIRPGFHAALQGLCDLYARKGAVATEQEAYDEAVQAYQAWADIAADPTTAQNALASLNQLIYHKLADRLRAEADREVENGYWLGAIQALSALTELPEQDTQEVQDLLSYVQGRAAFEAKNFQTAVEQFAPLYKRDPLYHDQLEALYHHAVAMVEAPMTELSITVGQQQPIPQLNRWLWALLGATVTALLFGGFILGQSLFFSDTSATPSVTLSPLADEKITTADPDPLLPPIQTTLPAQPINDVQLSLTEQANLPTAVPTLAPALPLTRTRSSDEMPQILMAAGRFLQGAGEQDEQAAANERPLHQRIVEPFYIDRYEVSVKQYARFLEQNGIDHRQGCDELFCVETGFETIFSHLIWDGNRIYRAEPSFETHPVTGVTWQGANAYCQAVGGRLPTETEWEYAARSQGNNNGIYPWGDTAPNQQTALFDQSEFESLLPRASFPAGATADSLYDMAGSVREWVNDYYDPTYYEQVTAANLTGPESGSLRVVRGGSWGDEASKLRVSARQGLSPTALDNTVGFRCVTPVG